MGGFSLENGVEFSVGAIGFVGNRAHNNERNVIQEARVSNSCTFHFATARRKRADDALFFSISAYELIARCNTAVEYSNISCNLRCRLLDNAAQLLVCGEINLLETRHLTRLVTKIAYVHIVMDGIGGHNQVANIDGGIKRTGHTRVNDMRHVETVNKNLRANTRVHLAHAAENNYSRHAVKRSFRKFHTCNHLGCCVFKASFQVAYLNLHGANNADFRHATKHARFLLGLPILMRRM